MKINSDNPAIEKNLRFLEQTIIDYGGFLDPDLLIKCEAGNLSVIKQGLPNPQSPLIALPEELLIPTEKMGLAVHNDEIAINPEKGAITDIQHKLAETMVELYNLTDKIKNHKKSCCWFAFRKDPETLKKLLRARTLNENQKSFLDFTTGNANDLNENEMLCKTYIKTRTIGHKQISAENDDVMLTTDIMPIVDFINHHHSGGFFRFNKNEHEQSSEHEFLRLNDSRPLPDSNECFAYYNQMDALDSFMNYDFPDSYAPYVRSIPVKFEIPDTGKIIIHSKQGTGHKGKLNINLSGLRPYIPNTIKNKDNAIEVSHIIIPTNNEAPNALRRVLRLLISNKTAATNALSPDKLWQCVLMAEEKIINENISFYKNLLTELNSNKDSVEINMIRMVADLQLTKLYKYSFDESHYANKNAQNESKKAAAAAE